MILYFSATGNTEFIAKELAKQNVIDIKASNRRDFRF